MANGISPAQRAYMRRRAPVLRARLCAQLSRTDGEAFLQLLWAVGVLQSGDPAPAKPFIRFPPQAATDEIGSRFAVHAWELEALANLSILTDRQQGPPFTACDDFRRLSPFINALRDYENVESGAFVEPGAIFEEMHRIGQRTFYWQRDHVNRPDFYRSIFLYGQGGAAEFFQGAYGFSIEDFTKAGFALFAALARHPSHARTFELGELSVTTEMVEKALGMMALPYDRAAGVLAQTIAAAGAANLQAAYQPNPAKNCSRGSISATMLLKRTSRASSMKRPFGVVRLACSSTGPSSRSAQAGKTKSSVTFST